MLHPSAIGLKGYFIGCILHTSDRRKATNDNMARSSRKGVDGFIISNEKGRAFLVDFLQSPDFTVDVLREICKSVNIKGYSVDKPLLANVIADEYYRHRHAALPRAIVEGLLRPFKEWFAIRKGQMPRTLSVGNPEELLEQPGREQWYGPIYRSSDPCPWYIHPIFVPHWIENTSSEHKNDEEEIAMVKCKIRWLCFARIESDYVSIHWRGLQHDPAMDFEDEDLGIKRQVETWKYIPTIFNELEEIGHRDLKDINLYRLVLDDLWEKFRYNKVDYRWHDVKLRSKSAGVKLNARSSTIVAVEIGPEEIRGLLSLTRMMRKAFIMELESRQPIPIDNPEHYDEVLLRALIKDFGALSYEFEVYKNPAGRLMRFNCYFGVQPGAKSDDDFPHIQVYKLLGDHVTQLQTILEHLRLTREYNDQPEQGALLQ